MVSCPGVCTGWGKARSIESVMPRGRGVGWKRNEPAHYRHGDGELSTSPPAWSPVSCWAPAGSGTSPTDVAGDVARQEGNSPAGNPRRSIVCVRVVPHVCAHGVYCCCCCLADAAVQPATRGMWARPDRSFADSGEVSSCVLLSLCTYTCLMSSPGGMKRGLAGTRTVTVGRKQTSVMCFLSPVIWRRGVGHVITAMHYQKCVSHGKELLPSIICWRVGSYASLLCVGHAKLIETKTAQEKVC